MILDQTIGDPPPIEKLSDQEYKIMRLLVEGKTIGEISETICLSRNTVANYHSHILQKLGLDIMAPLERNNSPPLRNVGYS